MPADFDISPLITPPAASPSPVQPTPTPVPSTPGPFAGVPPPSMPKKNLSQKLLKWLILVAVGLFVLTAVMLWFGGNSFSPSGVVVTLDTVDHTTSGDEVVYTVNYKNNTKVALTGMSFRLFYPQPGTLMIKDGQTTTPDSDGFTVATLNPGESGKQEFHVYLIGDKGEIKAAHVHVIFTAGTLKSSFEKDAAASVAITELPVTLTLVAPPTSISGQTVQYILDMRNDTTTDLSDLKAIFKYPDGFTVQQMQPQADEGNTTWRIAQLKAGQGKRITVSGPLTGNQQETKTVTVTLQQNVGGQYLDYVKTDVFTMISSPLLTVSLAPNQGRDYVAFAGDTLRYTVSYANNSQYTFSGMTLAVVLEGAMYDFSRLHADNGFYDDSSKTVTFDSSGLPDLANLRPGQTGRATFSVPLKAGLSGTASGAGNIFVKATVRLSTSNVPTGIDSSQVFAADSVVTKISSQPSLGESLLYDNGAGSGPVPPKVGQETVLTVRWQVTNPGNDVRNATVTATLPPGVTFKGSPSASVGTSPTFNATTNKVTWSIGTISFGTGTGLPPATATFQVSIRPSSNQVGQNPPIVNGATLVGTDSFTSQAIQVSVRNYTTDDIDGHARQGAVTP